MWHRQESHLFPGRPGTRLDPPIEPECCVPVCHGVRPAGGTNIPRERQRCRKRERILQGCRPVSHRLHCWNACTGVTLPDVPCLSITRCTSSVWSATPTSESGIKLPGSLFQPPASSQPIAQCERSVIAVDDSLGSIHLVGRRNRCPTSDRTCPWRCLEGLCCSRGAPVARRIRPCANA